MEPSRSSSKQPRITLYWLEDTRARRIHWLLEELHLEYTIVPFDKHGLIRAPAELCAVHPMGKTPVVTVEFPEETVTMIESGHIVNYLVRYFDTQKLLTFDTEKECRDVDMWLHSAEGSLQPPLTATWFPLRLAQDQGRSEELMGFVEEVKKMYTLPMMHQTLEYLESVLKCQREKYGVDEVYFVGDKFSAADLMLGHTIGTTIYGRELWSDLADKKKYPILSLWVEYAARGREAYQRTGVIQQEIIKGGYKVYTSC